jgi:RNA polymerase sigma-70 factor (ECF subfamily)
MTGRHELSAASDRDIVRSALAGREDAYGELVRRYRRRVRTSIYRIVHHTERTNDLAQETFVKAFNALDRYRSERRFLPWILTIATNAATDYVRRKRPDRADSPWVVTAGRIDAAQIFVTGATDTPTEPHRRDAARAVRRALKRLKPTYRRCVTLRYVENRSYAEIARLMGVSVGTVGTYLHRARNELKRMLG